MVNAIPGAPKSAAPRTTSCLMISVYGRHFRLQAGTNADSHRVYGNGASCALSPHVCAPHPTKRAPCAPLARPSRADCPLGRPALLRLPFGAARLPFWPAVWRCAVPTAAPPPAGVPSASLDTSPCALRVRAPWGVARAPPRRTPTVRRVAGARRVPPPARHLRPRTHRTVAFAQTAGTLKWSGNTPCCSPSAGPAPRRARVLFSSLTHHFSQLCVINTIYHRQNELSTFLWHCYCVDGGVYVLYT